MQTDKIKIVDYETGREAALNEAERFTKYVEFDSFRSLRVRLMVEETFAMVNAITEDFRADFWVEGDNSGLCKIHLDIYTEMDIDKKQGLINASREKRNAAVKGLTGKIWEVIENQLYLQRKEWSDLPSSYYMMGYGDMPFAAGAPIVPDDVVWTLESYRQGIDGAKDNDEDAKDAWDELEKSILANIADDLIVAIRGNKAELTVVKKFD